MFHEIDKEPVKTVKNQIKIKKLDCISFIRYTISIPIEQVYCSIAEESSSKLICLGFFMVYFFI